MLILTASKRLSGFKFPRKLREKKPKGNFVNLIPLWEAGLYPCGVIDGKFVVYVLEEKQSIPQLTGKTETIGTLPEIIEINGVKYKRI